MKTNNQTEKLVNKQIFVDLRQDPGFKAVFADINNKSLLIELLNEIRYNCQKWLVKVS